jgi:hypothetical protein
MTARMGFMAKMISSASISVPWLLREGIPPDIASIQAAPERISFPLTLFTNFKVPARIIFREDDPISSGAPLHNWIDSSSKIAWRKYHTSETFRWNYLTQSWDYGTDCFRCG